MSLERTDHWFAGLHDVLVEAYRRNGPCHDLTHVLRVSLLAERIAARELVDVDLAVLAALFHDAEHASAGDAGTDDHEVRSARLAERELRDRLAAPDLAEVVDAIAGRRFAKRHLARRPVGAVLDDADNLDAIGLVGASRTFLWVGEHGWRQAPGDAGVAATSGRNHEALEAHWREKLAHIAAGMRTRAGAELAARRHAALGAFVEGLGQELAAIGALARRGEAAHGRAGAT